MDALAITVVICATIIYALERTLPLLNRSERPKAQPSPPPYGPPQTDPSPGFTIEPMPLDLAQMADQESELWAKESALKKMFEVYEETRDWNVVRRMWKPEGPVS